MKDSKNQAPDNVIQFPGRREKIVAKPMPNTPPPPQPKPAASRKNLAGGVLAAMLLSVAVNHAAFRSSESKDLASNSTGRGLASVGPTYKRNADWERNLAQKLASPHARDVASATVGRSATVEERLRWGTLEEKYTITFRPDVREITSILLQNESGSTPSYVLNRDKFLNEYGSLLSDGFASAKLKSTQTVNERIIEAYTLYDKNAQPKGEAHFELDRHKRLLSLKVERAQI